MNTGNVYTVTQINKYIRGMFAQDFLLSGLCVRGEVSNVKYHSSGHIYFTIKDDGASLPAVMFAGSRKGLNFQLRDGMRVLVTGRIDVYERDGRYQLYASQISPDGLGELYLRYETLKRDLEDRGMFDSRYKQPIPRYISVLGVVTAPAGAAIRDIINITHRRNPYVQILLYPAQVQGEGAAKSIAKGIEVLDRRRPDCIIIGRGGGSLEDLWAFNEEIVAQAVFDCETPVISAVGHETDTVISDYVADLRAPTPSAAAELAVFDIRDFQKDLREKRELLDSYMQERLSREREKLERLSLRVRLHQPEHRIAAIRQSLGTSQDRLQQYMTHRIEQERHRLSIAAARLDQESPLKRLGGGYAYVTDEAGRAVSGVSGMSPGDTLMLTLPDGRASTQVTRIYKETSAAVYPREGTDIKGDDGHDRPESEQ